MAAPSSHTHSLTTLTHTTRYKPHATHTQGPTYKLWHEAEAESGMKVVVETGGIDVLERGSGVATALVDAARRCGVGVEEIEPAELARRYGVRISDDRIAVLQSGTGIVRATTAVAMFQSLARSHGATLRDGAKVTSLSQMSAGGRTLQCVMLADGTRLCAAKVVLTVGPWAQPVLESLCGLDVPLQVWQTTVMYFKAAAGVPDAGAKLAALPVLIDYRHDALMHAGRDARDRT